ncbi:MAG: hypothetical protein IRY92_09095, partial [Dactylosporangium sp.]|nr:hypothetical protein [Dactylosporangium sp.]
MTIPSQHALRIHTKYHWMSFMLAGFRPKATINGYEVPLNWGDNLIPAPPGLHQITVYVPYLWKFGHATITVDNTAGTPLVHYAAPVWTFQRGAIGTEPQRHPGMAAALIVNGIAVGALVLCCLGTVLTE